MPNLPYTFYTRPSWLIPDVTYLFEKYGSGRPQKAEDRWKPAGKLHLTEAVEAYGSRNVESWDGTERKARHRLRAPEPPWAHFQQKGHLPSLLTFDDDGKPLYREEREAKGWWQSIEHTLFDEWRAEMASCDRWKTAIDGLRSHLANKTVTAFLLPTSGHLDAIPASVWLSTDADGILQSGFAKIDLQAGYSGTVTKAGVVVIDEAELNKIWNKEGPSLAAASPIDQNTHPYLSFMIRAARELPFSPGRRMPKGKIEDWLERNWPETLGEPTQSKIRSMATLLRRPEDEGGGNLPN